MKHDGIKISSQLPANATESDFRILQQLGIKYCYTWIEPHQVNETFLSNFQDNCKKHGLTLYNVGVAAYGKSADVQLGLQKSEEHTEGFIDVVRLLGKLGISATTITWEPNCAWCTTPNGHVGRELFIPAGRGGALTRVCDEAILENCQLSHGRRYVREEIWQNFQRFIERVMPVAEASNVKIALHPNDPPVVSSAGIDTFITTSNHYETAFRIANSNNFGMELCVGCWLEGGKQFGNLLDDIRRFVRMGKVFIVHFRNVRGSLPYFEETFLDDGDANMYEIMKTLVQEDYKGTIVFDHAPIIREAPRVSESYSLGYMKALLAAAEHEREWGRG